MYYINYYLDSNAKSTMLLLGGDGFKNVPTKKIKITVCGLTNKKKKSLL